MPLFSLFDNDGLAHEFFSIDDMPPNVAMIIISCNQRRGGASYATLMKVLEALPAKLKKITIWGWCESSPEYPALIAATVNKTEYLSIGGISHLEQFEQIVTGLLQPNTLKDLDLNLRAPNSTVVPNDTLRMLLQALPSCSSLEKLYLAVYNSLDEDDLGNELASAIRGMRRLKILNLDVCYSAENRLLFQTLLRAVILDAQVKDLNLSNNNESRGDAIFHDDVWVETFRNPRCVLEKFRFDMRWKEENRMPLQRIFCSAILDAKVKDLVLFNRNMARALVIDHDVWVNTLCRQNCQLEKLHLQGIQLDNNEESLEGNSNYLTPNALKNTSVKELLLTRAKLQCAGTREILNRFPSLESLFVAGNSIQNISLFNNVLSGDEPTIQKLALEIEDVQEDDLKSFMSRIPHMRSLRALHLRIRNLKDGSNPCVDLLEKAVLRNTSLQLVKYSHGATNACDDKLGVWLSLNRAGQGFLQNGSIPSSLWPLILERAGKISYYSVRDTWERASMTDTRVDAVYWLLREKFLL